MNGQGFPFLELDNTPHTDPIMAIIRCSKCAHLQEQADELARQTVPCSNCANPTTVYPTLFYIEKLLEKYWLYSH
jgi:hypothetical protein